MAVAGVSKSGGASASAGIGGLVLVTSHGFHGSTMSSQHGISMSAIAGNGTGMETDYDYTSTLHAADLDSATARELNMQTTGHANRGVSSTPSPGPTNLHLTAGAKSPEQLIGEIEDGFYVTSLIGMGVNLVTGDYSRGASGFWIENGKLTYPVSEVTIAGHLSEMFKSLTQANDLVFRYGTNAPTVRLEGMTVAGQ